MKILYLPNHYSQQRQHEKKVSIWPVHLAMEATYQRNCGHDVDWDIPIKKPYNKIIREVQGIPFSLLPAPDRVLTQAFNPKYQQNGNFKYLPGTYILSANSCWWGKCTFCVENKIKEYYVRPVDTVMDEIEDCVAMGFKELFDDSGTFPQGEWVNEFCYKFSRFHFDYGVRIGCNMRMVDCDYVMLRNSGFRMVLFGLESANQETLDKINKGTQVEDVYYIIKAAKAGLDCHVAVMFGYPFETDEGAIRTLKLVHWLLRKGYVKTAQASFYVGPEGAGNESQRKYVKQIYGVWKYPDFWVNKLRDIKDVDDIKYLWRAIKNGVFNLWSKKSV